MGYSHIQRFLSNPLFSTGSFTWFSLYHCSIWGSTTDCPEVRKSASHSWAACDGPKTLSWSFLQLLSLSGWTVQCNLIVLNPLTPSTASTHWRWNQLPTPLGVDNVIQSPPVANVCCAAVHIDSACSINAASSKTKSDNASERPESSLDETAFTWEPFLYIVVIIYYLQYISVLTN